MANTGEQSKSHLGFFVALLVVVAVGGLAYWGYAKYAEPIAEQTQTAAQNPGSPHPPKDKMPEATRAGATASKPATSSEHEVDVGTGK